MRGLFLMGYIEDPLGTGTEQMEPGYGGTLSTVVVMQRVATQATLDPEIRKLAEDIVRPLAQRDWKAEARAIEAWVRRGLRYTRDGLNVETLKTPRSLSDEFKAHGKFTGDCDDASMLVAALLLAVGHRPSFLLLGRKDVPHHVCVLDRTTGLTLDPTGEPRGPFGFRRAFDVQAIQP
jgi:hypothetical protein